MYPSLIRYLGPPLVKELNRRCKQLRIEFEHGATSALIDQICAGRVDYAIGVAGENHPRLESRSDRNINEVPLPLQWSTMGLTFLYKDGRSNEFRQLWELLTRPKVSLEELTSVLLDHAAVCGRPASKQTSP